LFAWEMDEGSMHIGKDWKGIHESLNLITNSLTLSWCHGLAVISMVLLCVEKTNDDATFSNKKGKSRLQKSLQPKTEP
jgi:hypothetical protein